MEGRGGQWRTVLFTSLDAAKRSEVDRLARRGLLHPDPVVAASSVAWAYRVMSSRSRFGRAGGVAVGGALGVAGIFVSVLSYVPSSGLNPGDWVREQRLARRIARAAITANYEAPAWVRIPEHRGPRVTVAELATQGGFNIETAQESTHGKHKAGRRRSR